MRLNSYIGITMMATGMLVASSCSDFNDYNETPALAMPSAELTLWENISQNSQLTDFAALVKRTGFDAYLNAPNSYTVWAPVNGSFSVSDYAQMSDSLILAQFVKSHVAEYPHAASGKVEERVHMLNKKSFLFAGEGNYTFDDIALTQANLPGTNGVMHLLNGVAAFYPNLYEYLRMEQDIDSLRNHIMRYELTELDQDASVKGPMVDGRQTYIDSVMVTTNRMINQLGALINNEDSSYTFLMPTNKAYMDLYNRVKPVYNIINTTKVQDPENFTKAGDSQTKQVTVDADFLSDSLTRRAVVRNLIFSNNDAYNRWVVDKGVFTDTLRSTTRTKLSNPTELLESYAVGQPKVMSNGYARKVDSLAFYSWETFNPKLTVNPRNTLAYLANGSAHANQSVPDSLIQRIFGPEADFTSYRYLWIEPSGGRAKPDFNILLPNVLSTTYNFYVVFMPSAMKQFGNDARPNKLNFTLSYCQANGNLSNYNFGKAYADSLLSGGKLPAVPTKVDMNTAFENNPEKTDTVFIGRFTFPVSYSGIGNYSPNIRVQCPLNVFSSEQLATYSRDVRIAAIIMKPVELEEFEANKK